MRTVRWLQAVAVLWLLSGAVGGTLLISFRGSSRPGSAAGILWRVAVNLAAGRTTAGWPRA